MPRGRHTRRKLLAVAMETAQCARLDILAAANQKAAAVALTSRSERRSRPAAPPAPRATGSRAAPPATKFAGWNPREVIPSLFYGIKPVCSGPACSPPTWPAGVALCRGSVQRGVSSGRVVHVDRRVTNSPRCGHVSRLAPLPQHQSESTWAQVLNSTPRGVA
ncbi:unnamed protein product [Lampetra planeri]